MENIEDLSLAELKELAKDKGVKNISKLKKEELVLDDSVKQNKQGQPILGRLQGPCADFILPTRNGRKYDESL